MLVKQMLSAVDHLLPAIRSHRFNTELFAGTLPREVFDFYLRQDIPYLNGFSAALTQLSVRLSGEEQTQQLVTLSKEVTDYAKFICDQELLRHETAHRKSPAFTLFSKKESELTLSMTIAPIPLVTRQINYLLHNAQHAPPAVAIASLLPCYVIYRDLGEALSMDHQHPAHPYKEWITFYSCREFLDSTNSLTTLMQTLHEQNPCSQQRVQMIDAFVSSSQFELNFWDAACAVYENKAEPRGLLSRCISASS